jgi:hypothetical protein
MRDSQGGKGEERQGDQGKAQTLRAARRPPFFTPHARSNSGALKIENQKSNGERNVRKTRNGLKKSHFAVSPLPFYPFNFPLLLALLPLSDSQKKRAAGARARGLFPWMELRLTNKVD